MINPRGPIRILSVGLAALALGACSSENTIAEAEVEAAAATELAAATGQDEPNIDCPSDLDAEVGATMECELSVDGDPQVFPVTVTVESIEDGTANFSVEVGDAPIGDDSGSEGDTEPADDGTGEGDVEPTGDEAPTDETTETSV